MYLKLGMEIKDTDIFIKKISWGINEKVFE
jgi:hypothetical protein